MLIIFSFQPLIDFIVEYLTCKYFRWSYRSTEAGKVADKKSLENKKHKVYELDEFINLYAGPQYLIYYKCANTNMMVFITLIFGPSLPILYFITCWSIFC